MVRPNIPMSELSGRAVAVGLAIGCLVGASNVAAGLKTGLTFGTTITAAVLGFAFFRIWARISSRPYSMQENLITTTAGSAAGSTASAAGLVSFMPALALAGRDLSYWELVLWTFSIGFLGVLFAIPLRPLLLIREKLRFPSGTATAETIAAMHTAGSNASTKASILLWAALAAAGTKLAFSYKPLGLAAWETLSLDRLELGAVSVLGASLAGLRLGVSISPMMIGAGMLVGPRVGWSLVLGSTAAWGLAAPLLISSGTLTVGTLSPYSAVLRWLVWPGVALMVSAGLTSLGWHLPAWGRFAALLGRKTPPSASEEAAEDVPGQIPAVWWLVGLTGVSLTTVALARWLFSMPAWLGMLGVALSFLMAAIAVRATGETDLNPVGPMGKVTQLVYGAIAPGNMITNLMAAGVTAAGASQAGDLMHDLKAGLLLRVSVRRQVVAQLLGVVAGVFVVTGAYCLLRKAYTIPGDDFTAPAVQAWHAVAMVLAQGWSGLPNGAALAAVVGAVLGLSLTLLGRWPAVAAWTPSPVALGIACLVPAHYSASMWLGALVLQIWQQRARVSADQRGVPLASGLIAGEGIMTVLAAVLLLMGVPGIS